MFGTLIGDCDGIYDPADYNDRLLLGLKGTMSEAELYQIKQRMLAGWEAKAQRGELHFNLSRGYVQRPSGEIVKDPDEQVQATIALVFEQFERLGNLNRLLHYLVQHHIPMPDRIRGGLQKGNLVWRRPNRHSLADMLHNSIYAGAYVYGRRCSDPRRRKPGRPYGGKIVAKPGEWRVRRLDQLPRYISWEQYERNQRQLQQNSNAQGIGAIRRDPAFARGSHAARARQSDRRTGTEKNQAVPSAHTLLLAAPAARGAFLTDPGALAHVQLAQLLRQAPVARTGRVA